MNFIKAILSEVSNLTLTYKSILLAALVSVVLLRPIYRKTQLTPLCFLRYALKTNHNLVKNFGMITVYMGVMCIFIVPRKMYGCTIKEIGVYVLFVMILSTIKLYEVYLSTYKTLGINANEPIVIGNTPALKLVKWIVYLHMFFLSYDLSMINNILLQSSEAVFSSPFHALAQSDKLKIVVMLLCLCSAYSTSYRIMSTLNLFFTFSFVGLLLGSFFFLKAPITLCSGASGITLKKSIEMVVCAMFTVDAYSMFTFFDAYHYKMYYLGSGDHKKFHQESMTAASFGILVALITSLCCVSVCHTMKIKDVGLAIYSAWSANLSKNVVYIPIILISMSAFFSYAAAAKSTIHMLIKNNFMTTVLHWSCVAAFTYVCYQHVDNLDTAIKFTTCLTVGLAYSSFSLLVSELFDRQAS